MSSPRLTLVKEANPSISRFVAGLVFCHSVVPGLVFSALIVQGDDVTGSPGGSCVTPTPAQPELSKLVTVKRAASRLSRAHNERHFAFKGHLPAIRFAKRGKQLALRRLTRRFFMIVSQMMPMSRLAYYSQYQGTITLIPWSRLNVDSAVLS